MFTLDKPIRGVWPLKKIQAIFMAGEEMGISVVIKAEEGQRFQYDMGGMGTVDEGYAYVEIGSPKREDLNKFWKRVDRIISPKEK